MSRIMDREMVQDYCDLRGEAKYRDIRDIWKGMII